MRNLYRLAIVANIFEFYELSIYGYLSALISRLFFSDIHPTLALTQTFGLFAIGYLARPIGGLVLGKISDTWGRAQALRLSLGLMAVATTGMGLLPTYSQVGFWATGSLLVLRLVQGFSVGGEAAGSGCYLFEKTPKAKRSVLCSLVVSSSTIGFLLGSGVASLLFSYFDEGALLAWAWRVPFLLSIPLAAIVYSVRRSLEETPSESIHKHTIDQPASTVRAMTRPFLIGAPLIAFAEVLFYPFLVWMPTYVSHFLQVPVTVAHYTNTLTLSVMAILQLLVGHLSARWGYKLLILIATAGFLLGVYPLFQLLLWSQGSVWTLLGFQFFIASIIGVVGGTMMEVLGDLFPANIRGRGMNITHALPNVLIGASAPVVCNYMISQGFSMFPIFYAMFFGLMALIAAIQLKKQPI